MGSLLSGRQDVCGKHGFESHRSVNLLRLLIAVAFDLTQTSKSSIRLAHLGIVQDYFNTRD